MIKSIKSKVHLKKNCHLEEHRSAFKIKCQRSKLIWAPGQENLSRGFANNKGADQRNFTILASLCS